MRNVMMDSFLPVLKDRAETLITLEGSVHEMRRYAGMPIDTRRLAIQAGSIGFATTRSFNSCFTIDRTVFIEHRCEKFLRSDLSREPTGGQTYTQLPPHDPLP
jgi:hypothetical protein